MLSLAGQGWLQLGELTLAFVLSALIGVEREIRQKSAGLRTYTLVGVAAALFMLVSKYGFNDILRPGVVVLDLAGLAVQQLGGAAHRGPVRDGDRLVTEADAEQRDAALLALADHLDADAGVLRRAGTR